MKKKKTSPFNWNFTTCRAKYKGHKECNYTFYIVDYVYGEWPEQMVHITTLRNVKSVNTAYFMNESQARRFINTEGGRITVDDVFEKAIKKYRTKMIDNMFKK